MTHGHESDHEQATIERLQLLSGEIRLKQAEKVWWRRKYDKRLDHGPRNNEKCDQ